jgi:hypothetical protein
MVHDTKMHATISKVDKEQLRYQALASLSCLGSFRKRKTPFWFLVVFEESFLDFGNKIFDRQWIDTPQMASDRHMKCKAAPKRNGLPYNPVAQTTKSSGLFRSSSNFKVQHRAMTSSTTAIIRLKRKRTEDPLPTLCTFPRNL